MRLSQRCRKKMSEQWDLGTALFVFMFFLFVLAALGWVADKMDE